MKKLILGILFVFLFSPVAFAEDVVISWGYASGMENVTGFKLYASTESGEYAEEDVIATVDYNTGEAEYSANATLESVAGQETIYYFVATAYNENQESKYSNEVSYPVLGEPVDLRFEVTVSTDNVQ